MLDWLATPAGYLFFARLGYFVCGIAAIGSWLLAATEKRRGDRVLYRLLALVWAVPVLA